MIQGLQKTVLDIDVLDTNNSKTLVFVDSSSYISQPEKPLMEITLPGYSKYFLVNVIANRVNTFNSSSIGLNTIINCSGYVDLPDGIYTIKYKTCPYDFSFIVKSFVKISLINNQIASIYNQIDLNTCDKSIKDDLINMHLLLEGSKSIVNINLKKATDYFNTASDLVSTILNKICINCK